MTQYCRSLKSVSRRNGFTLIETLVAVMILAISLVVIMQLFSGGLKSNKISSDYLYGIFHASEKMEELLLSDPVLPGSFSGEFDDGYRWSSVIEEAPDGDETADKKIPVVTMNINVDIFWKNGEREKHFRLSTTALTDKKAITEDTGNTEKTE